MTTEVFIPYKPHAATLRVVEQGNAIIGEYLARGFALTLRQLFYQFVARALLGNAASSIGTLLKTAPARSIHTPSGPIRQASLARRRTNIAGISEEKI